MADILLCVIIFRIYLLINGQQKLTTRDILINVLLHHAHTQQPIP